MLKLGKKGLSSGAAALIMILILSVVAIQYTGIYDFQDLTGKKEVEDEVIVPVFCDPTAGITVKLDAVDPWSKATVGGNNKYKIIDGTDSALSSVADAGTFSAPANKKLDIWMQIDAPVHYTAELKGVDVGCTSPLVITQNVMPEGNLTFTFTGESGVTSIKEGLNNESIAAGAVEDLEFSVKGDYQGHQPYNVVVVEWNKTAIDEVFLSIGGTKLAKANVPESHTDKLSSGRQTAYVFPTIEQNAKVEGLVTVDADDTVEPRVDAGTDYSCIFFTFFDYDCVETDEAPFVECGVTEDPDDGTTDVGDTNPQTFICYT